jgi:small subunit ribosomal protein S9
MTEKYVQAVGRRKRAIAQVRVYVGGSGKFTVNDQEMKEYFNSDRTRRSAMLPLVESGKIDSVDVTVRAEGGGKIGQSDAVKMGVARALVAIDEANKPVMRAHGLLTRDARAKERKKFGRRGARRSPQWRKR